MSQESNEPRTDQAPYYCAYHPGVETGLSCSRCGKHICTRCMVQAPVGIRCRDCANVQKLPTFDVRPSYYMRASVTAMMVGAGVGLLWGGILLLFPYSAMAGFLSIGVGYGVGESVSVMTNRKRGGGLVAVSLGGMLVALLVAAILQDAIFRLLFADYIGVLLLALGGFAAVNRLR